MVERRFITVTEGHRGDKPVVRKIEVCMECGEQAPVGRNPDRVCNDCNDGRNGEWTVSSYRSSLLRGSGNE